MKYILHIAFIISVITYLFWENMPKGSFYVGNALFIMLLCAYIFYKDRSKIAFVLLVASVSNLFDELFFDPTKLQLNELLIWAFALFYLNGRVTK